MNRLKREFTWYSFIIVSLVAYVLIAYIPTLTSLRYSFYKVAVLGFGEEFRGLKNYEILLSSRGFLKAVGNTFALAGFDLFTIIFGLVLASLLNRIGKGRAQSFFRIGFYLPNILTGVSVVLIFQVVLKQEGGLLNNFLSLLSVRDVQIGWLSDSNISKLGASIIAWWKGVGYAMLICLAGLQSIPSEIYEASKVDGCGGLQQWLYITLPQMTQTLVFLLITNLIASFSRFSDLYVLGMNSASGRPGGSLQTIMMYIYQYSFESPNYGISSAGAIILFLMVFAITLVNLKLTRFFED